MFTYDEDKNFNGFWFYITNENNYTINEKGEIVSGNSGNFGLESGTFVRRIDLDEGEISDTQIEKNKKRMVYIGDIYEIKIDNDKIICCDADTSKIIKSDDNSNWVGNYYVGFTDSEKNDIQLIVNSDLNGIIHPDSSEYKVEVPGNNLGVNFNIKRNNDIVYAYRSRNIEQGEFLQNTTLLAAHLALGVDIINNNAFASSNLTQMKISYGLHTINPNAFEDCNKLTQVIIPSSVTTINTNSFASCENLEAIVIHNNITTIAENAFSNCNNINTIIIIGCSDISKVNENIKKAFGIGDNTHEIETDETNNMIIFTKV